jgi:hypothetical protein
VAKPKYEHKGLRFPIGTKIGRKKVSATLHLPNKEGVVVGHGEKKNAAGAIQRFYIVKTTKGATEEWSPGIVYELGNRGSVDLIAFV